MSEKIWKAEVKLRDCCIAECSSFLPMLLLNNCMPPLTDKHCKCNTVKLKLQEKSSETEMLFKSVYFGAYGWM